MFELDQVVFQGVRYAIVSDTNLSISGGVIKVVLYPAGWNTENDKLKPSYHDILPLLNLFRGQNRGTLANVITALSNGEPVRIGHSFIMQIKNVRKDDGTESTFCEKDTRCLLIHDRVDEHKRDAVVFSLSDEVPDDSLADAPKIDVDDVPLDTQEVANCPDPKVDGSRALTFNDQLAAWGLRVVRPYVSEFAGVMFAPNREGSVAFARTVEACFRYPPLLQEIENALKNDDEEEIAVSSFLLELVPVRTRFSCPSAKPLPFQSDEPHPPFVVAQYAREERFVPLTLLKDALELRRHASFLHLDPSAKNPRHESVIARRRAAPLDLLKEDLKLLEELAGEQQSELDEEIGLLKAAVAQRSTAHPHQK